MTFKNNRKLILFEATFEVKTSSFFRLIEDSGNTLSAVLMSGLLFELLTIKNVANQLQNLMAQTGFVNLHHLLLVIVTDQLQNLMIETEF